MNRAIALATFAIVLQCARALVTDWVKSQIADAQKRLQPPSATTEYKKISKQHYDVLLETLVSIASGIQDKCTADCDARAFNDLEDLPLSESLISDDGGSLFSTPTRDTPTLPEESQAIAPGNVAIVDAQLDAAMALAPNSRARRYEALARRYARAITKYATDGVIRLDDVTLSPRTKHMYTNRILTAVRESGAPATAPTVSPVFNEEQQIVLGGTFYSAGAFHASGATQDDVYTSEVQPLVANVLDGANAALFAYGQTGSGKTYTMFNSASSAPEIADGDGMALRAIDALLGSLAPGESLEMSFVQVGGASVSDLLVCDAAAITDTKIQLTDSAAPIFYTRQNAPEVKTHAILKLVEARSTLKAALRRHITDKTEYNSDSSRTHAVLVLRAKRKTSNAVFVIVDLAGNERDKTARPDAIDINKSLTELKTMMLSGQRQSQMLSKVLVDVVLGVDSGAVKRGPRARLNQSINKFIFTTRREARFEAQTAETLKFCSDLVAIGTRAARRSSLSSSSTPLLGNSPSKPSVGTSPSTPLSHRARSTKSLGSGFRETVIDTPTSVRSGSDISPEIKLGKGKHSAIFGVRRSLAF